MLTSGASSVLKQMRINAAVRLMMRSERALTLAATPLLEVKLKIGPGYLLLAWLLGGALLIWALRIFHLLFFGNSN